MKLNEVQGDIKKFLPLLICILAIFTFTVNYSSATTMSSVSSNMNSDIQSVGSTHTDMSQSSVNSNSPSSERTSSFNITNKFHEVNKTNFSKPGNVVTQSNYCNWVWTVINIKNNGPDAGNITIKDTGSSGFIYYNPKIKWNGWVLYNDGTGWVKDKNFNITTGMGSYYILAGQTYQIAILGLYQ